MRKKDIITKKEQEALELKVLHERIRAECDNLLLPLISVAAMTGLSSALNLLLNANNFQWMDAYVNTIVRDLKRTVLEAMLKTPALHHSRFTQNITDWVTHETSRAFPALLLLFFKNFLLLTIYKPYFYAENIYRKQGIVIDDHHLCAFIQNNLDFFLKSVGFISLPKNNCFKTLDNIIPKKFWLSDNALATLWEQGLKNKKLQEAIAKDAFTAFQTCVYIAQINFNCFIHGPLQITTAFVIVPKFYFKSRLEHYMHHAVDQFTRKLCNKNDLEKKLRTIVYMNALIRAILYVAFLWISYDCLQDYQGFSKNTAILMRNETILSSFRHAHVNHTASFSFILSKLSQHYGLGVSILYTVFKHLRTDLSSFWQYLSCHYAITHQEMQLSTIFNTPRIERKKINNDESLYYFLIDANALLAFQSITQKDYFISEVLALLKKWGLKADKPNKDVISIYPFSLSNRTVLSLRDALEELYVRLKAMEVFKNNCILFYQTVMHHAPNAILKYELQDQHTTETGLPISAAKFSFSQSHKKQVCEFFEKLFSDHCTPGNDDQEKKLSVIYVLMAAIFPKQSTVISEIQTVKQPKTFTLSAERDLAPPSPEHSQASTIPLPTPKKRRLLPEFFYRPLSIKSALPNTVRFGKTWVYPPAEGTKIKIYPLPTPYSNTKHPYANINGTPLYCTLFGVLTADFGKYENYREKHAHCLETGNIVYLRHDANHPAALFKTHPNGNSGIGDSRVYATQTTRAKVGEQQVTLYHFDTFVPHAH